MNKYVKSKTIVNISNLDNDKLDIQEAFEVLKDGEKPESLFYDGYIKGCSDFDNNTINEDFMNNDNDFNSGYLEAISYSKKIEDQDKNIKKFMEWKKKQKAIK